MKTLRTFLVLSIAGAALLGAGCTQTKAVYVLNPDGSGKARIQLIQPVVGPNRMWVAYMNSTHRLREIASDIVSKSSGILAWRDVEYRLLTLEQDDEMLLFEGVIYFMDIAEVKFHDQVVMYKLSLREDERGNSVLSLDFRPGKDKDEEAEDADGGEVPAVENITGQDAELRKRLKASRKRVSLRMMQALLEVHREEYVFKLPGPVLELTGLQENDNRTVAFVCDGAELSDKLFDLHEKGDITFPMRSDTPDFLEQLKNLKVEEQLDEIEGITLHAEATFMKGGRPQFDFEKEVREAKGSQGEMFKKLGLEFRPLDTSGQDHDDDGFATAEEVQAGTDPRDRTDHPPFATRLRFIKAASPVFPIQLKAIAGNDRMPKEEWDLQVQVWRPDIRRWQNRLGVRLNDRITSGEQQFNLVDLEEAGRDQAGLQRYKLIVRNRAGEETAVVENAGPRRDTRTRTWMFAYFFGTGSPRVLKLKPDMWFTLEGKHGQEQRYLLQGTEDKPWVYIERKGGDKLVIKDFRKGEFEVKAGHQDGN